MRFLSIAVFAGLVASVTALPPTFAKLEARAICSSGKGLDGNVCRNCPAGQFSQGGNNALCQTCPAGSDSKNSGASYCDCQPGYWSSNGKTTGNACAACSAGSISNRNNDGCTQCSAGTYADGDTCETCPPGYTSGAGAASCTPRCQAGSYWSNNSCKSCPKGKYSSAGATQCTSCPADTFSSVEGASSCQDCPAGTTSSGGADQCITLSCNAGKYPSGGSCTNCPAGTYSLAGAASCSACPAGSVATPGSKSCTACEPGKVPDDDHKTCKQCLKNTYSDGEQCIPCPAGSTSNPGSTSCGPQPSKRAQPVLDSVPRCFGRGMQLCDVFSGVGGKECINTFTTLDSCGGCVGPEGDEDTTGKYTGRDCSAIPHVDKVKCVRGGCEIKSCRAGYEPSDGSCVEKAAYTGKNQPSHVSRAKRTLLGPRHDTF